MVTRISGLRKCVLEMLGFTPLKSLKSEVRWKSGPFGWGGSPLPGHQLIPQGWRRCLVPPRFPLLHYNKAYRFCFF